MKYYEVLFNFAMYFTYTILQQWIMDPALWMWGFNTVTGSNVFPDRYEIRFERFLLLYFSDGHINILQSIPLVSLVQVVTPYEVGARE